MFISGIDLVVGARALKPYDYGRTRIFGKMILNYDLKLI